jgi:lipopolysaccharide export system permease protein
VSILDRYVMRSILGSVLMVAAVLLILGALAVFIDQQDDIGRGTYTTLDAVSFTLLSLPQQAFELLPITALIGSLLGLGSLARSSEITVIRATGVSIAHLAGMAFLAGLVLIGFAVVLGEFLGPALEQAAREQKAFSRLSNVGFGSHGGAWVRDGDLFLHVSGQSGETQFGGVQTFELSPQHDLLALGTAERGTAGTKGLWLLSNYTESRFSGDSVVKSGPGQRILKSNVTAGFLGLASQNPGQLTNRSLFRLIRYYRTNSLSDRDYVFAFWSRIARTVAVAFTVLLAIPFVLGSLRTAGAGTRMLMGLVLGIGFFLLQRLIESGTVVFNLNPVLLALVVFVLLARVR